MDNVGILLPDGSDPSLPDSPTYRSDVHHGIYGWELAAIGTGVDESTWPVWFVLDAEPPSLHMASPSGELGMGSTYAVVSTVPRRTRTSTGCPRRSGFLSFTCVACLTWQAACGSVGGNSRATDVSNGVFGDAGTSVADGGANRPGAGATPLIPACAEHDPPCAICGGHTCAGAQIAGGAALAGCCSAIAQGCSLDLSAIGIAECVSRDQRGAITPSCPGSKPIDLGTGHPVALTGCCRPDGACGYWLEQAGDTPLGLGCISVSELAVDPDAGTVACNQ